MTKILMFPGLVEFLERYATDNPGATATRITVDLCHYCEGLGQLAWHRRTFDVADHLGIDRLTGAHHPDHYAFTCPDCGGSGRLQVMDEYMEDPEKVQAWQAWKDAEEQRQADMQAERAAGI
jgi:hypothetical protein